MPVFIDPSHTANEYSSLVWWDYMPKGSEKSAQSLMNLLLEKAEERYTPGFVKGDKSLRYRHLHQAKWNLENGKWSWMIRDRRPVALDGIPNADELVKELLSKVTGSPEFINSKHGHVFFVPNTFFIMVKYPRDETQAKWTTQVVMTNIKVVHNITRTPTGEEHHSISQLWFMTEDVNPSSNYREDPINDVSLGTMRQFYRGLSGGGTSSVFDDLVGHASHIIHQSLKASLPRSVKSVARRIPFPSRYKKTKVSTMNAGGATLKSGKVSANRGNCLLENVSSLDLPQNRIGRGTYPRDVGINIASLVDSLEQDENNGSRVRDIETRVQRRTEELGGPLTTAFKSLVTNIHKDVDSNKSIEVTRSGLSASVRSDELGHKSV